MSVSRNDPHLLFSAIIDQVGGPRRGMLQRRYGLSQDELTILEGAAFSLKFLVDRYDETGP